MRNMNVFPPSGRKISAWQVLSKECVSRYTDSDWLVSPHLLYAPASCFKYVFLLLLRFLFHFAITNFLFISNEAKFSFVVKDPRVEVIFPTKVVFPAGDLLIKILIPLGIVYVINRAASKYSRVAKNTRAFRQ